MLENAGDRLQYMHFENTERLFYRVRMCDRTLRVRVTMTIPSHSDTRTVRREPLLTREKFFSLHRQ